MGWFSSAPKKKKQSDDDDGYDEDGLSDSEEVDVSKKKKKGWFSSSSKPSQSKQTKSKSQNISSKKSSSKVVKKDEANANEKRQKEKQQEEEIRAKKQAEIKARLDREKRQARKLKEEEEENLKREQKKEKENARKKEEEAQRIKHKKEMEKKENEMRKQQETHHAKKESTAHGKQKERRYGEDGELYTKKEFYAEYAGYDEWENAAPEVKEDGGKSEVKHTELETKEEFKKEMKEEKIERRYGEDGELYTEEEFYAEYGGYDEWDDAVVENEVFEKEKAQLEELWKSGVLSDEEYEEGLELAAEMASASLELEQLNEENQQDEEVEVSDKEIKSNSQEVAEEKEGPAGMSVIENKNTSETEQLRNLRESGVLSEQEYQEALVYAEKKNKPKHTEDDIVAVASRPIIEEEEEEEEKDAIVKESVEPKLENQNETSRFGKVVELKKSNSYLELSNKVDNVGIKVKKVKKEIDNTEVVEVVEDEERRWDGDNLFTKAEFLAFYGDDEVWKNAIPEEKETKKKVRKLGAHSSMLVEELANKKSSTDLLSPKKNIQSNNQMLSPRLKKKNSTTPKSVKEVMEVEEDEERRWDGDNLFTKAEFIAFYGDDEVWKNAIPEEKEIKKKVRKLGAHSSMLVEELANKKSSTDLPSSPIKKPTSPRLKKSIAPTTAASNIATSPRSRGYLDSCASHGIEIERVVPKKATVKEIEAQRKAEDARLLKVLEEEKRVKLKLEKERLELLKQQRAEAAAERLDMKAKQSMMNPLPKSVPKLKPYVPKKLKQPTASLLLAEGREGSAGYRKKYLKAIKYENYLGSTPTLMDEAPEPAWKKSAKIDPVKKRHREEAKRMELYVASKQLLRQQEEQRRFEEGEDYMTSGYNAYGGNTVDEEFGDIQENYEEEVVAEAEYTQETEEGYDVGQEEEEEVVDEGEYLNRIGVLKLKKKKVSMVIQAEAFSKDASLFLHRESGEANQQWVFEMSGSDRIRASCSTDDVEIVHTSLVLEAGHQVHVHGHGVHKVEEMYIHLAPPRNDYGDEVNSNSTPSSANQRWLMDAQGYIGWKKGEISGDTLPDQCWVLGWSYTKHLKNRPAVHGGVAGGGARIVLVKKTSKHALRFKFKDINDPNKDDEDDFEEQEMEEEEEEEGKGGWWRRGKQTVQKGDNPSGEELGFVGRLKQRRARALQEKRSEQGESSISTTASGENSEELGWVGRLKERRARSLEAKANAEAKSPNISMNDSSISSAGENSEELGWVGRLKERRARSLEAKANAEVGKFQRQEKGGVSEVAPHEKESEEKVGWWGRAKKRIKERKSAKQFEEEILQTKSNSILTPQPKKQPRKENDVINVSSNSHFRDVTLSPIISTRDDGYTHNVLDSNDTSLGYQ